jgi:hypothetical protein
MLIMIDNDEDKPSYSFKYQKVHSIGGLIFFSADFISTHFKYQVYSIEQSPEFQTES